ncbi:unnamed protein product [Schistosoma mattheei]|uniref:Uncharacterized protein n=1 Tax=Schistosoma mattheei TaxID=31246 RepID=A0A3P7YSC9_9TREM|nr:unnamed protein product [Schistosoma mattheei]
MEFRSLPSLSRLSFARFKLSKDSKNMRSDIAI